MSAAVSLSRAKAEAAKAKLEFAKLEARLKKKTVTTYCGREPHQDQRHKEKSRTECRPQIVISEKEAATTEAQAL